MIWQFVTRKKCRRQLNLIELLREERYSVGDFAEKLAVSRKTILRDLYELQQKKYVEKNFFWQINWRQEPSYTELYRKLLWTDDRFQLFQQYLWNRGNKNVNYSKVKELNQQLVELNLTANRRTGSLIGEEALILHLQLHYLRDFFSNTENELYQHVEQNQCSVQPFNNMATCFPDPHLLKQFAKSFGLKERYTPYFFLDYTRCHYSVCADFFHLHQLHQTSLYQATILGMQVIEPAIQWDSTLVKKIFTVKLFDLFIGIHQGLPLSVYNLYRKSERPSNYYYVLSKELKRESILLVNCRLDELAKAIHQIFQSSRQMVMNANLESPIAVVNEANGLFSAFQNEK
ncbi:HTH domain-containing protein [Enterococcus hermanniensis]|uniref:Helix-turn-helix type 11 domain-containing protein n=1 Tax=Enterococcus hermanniensis TaxID=249189 RepID=A0A1L8TRY3_9ENTE|nr:HTH domain-containing protein [Enterococcus hermanniensis]OJG46973.1 hypothetical protein RV04_GL000220 [Enterococcus hermanniensis]